LGWLDNKIEIWYSILSIMSKITISILTNLIRFLLGIRLLTQSQFSPNTIGKHNFNPTQNENRKVHHISRKKYNGRIESMKFDSIICRLIVLLSRKNPIYLCVGIGCSCIFYPQLPSFRVCDDGIRVANLHFWLLSSLIRDPFLFVLRI